MFDAELDAELDPGASTGGAPPARLGTPPGIGGASSSAAAAAAPPQVPAAKVDRMLAAYPTESAKIEACVPTINWCIHAGSDWPAEEATCENERGPLHLEVHFTDLRVLHMSFPEPEDGDVEWHLRVTLRDMEAIDR